MMIDTRQLLRLPVVTEDGQRIGHLVALVVDVDTHAIRHYVVCPDQCLKNWMHQRRAAELLIAPAQVVAVKTDCVVVESGAIRAAERSKEASHTHAIANAPAAPAVAPTSASIS